MNGRALERQKDKNATNFASDAKARYAYAGPQDRFVFIVFV